MDLSLDSALSLGGLVGHLSYFLLVLSMLMRRLWALRVLAVGSALTGIAYDTFWLEDPVGVFWESLLLTVNLVQLGVMRWEDRRASFSEEEEAFVHTSFPGLSRAQGRKLLSLGVWISGEAGTVLTREGDAVGHLFYLADGRASISLGDVVVAECVPGAFIGEMTVLGEDPATSTAVLSAPSRYWAVDARVLRQLADADPEIRKALNISFSRNLRDKLVRSNRMMADLRDPSASRREVEGLHEDDK